MEFEGFIGESYTSRAVNFDCQRSLNLYLEADESGQGKSTAALLGTPGLTLATTLSHGPVRGIWTGLIENLPGSTGADLAYAVGGSKLYQLTYNLGVWSSLLLGDVGSDGYPVTFEVNGSQLLITSAGLAWIWDGTTLGRAYFNNGLGTCDTAGTAVTWDSGDAFDSSLVGSAIVIGSTTYVISAVPDATHLTLAASAGVQAGAPSRIVAGAGHVNVNNQVITWVWGDDFTGISGGSQILLQLASGPQLCTVALVPAPTPTVLHVTTIGLGVQFGVDYQADKPVPGAMCAFLDTSFLVLPPNSKKVYYSGPNDGKSWSPLDFFSKESYPDNLSAILADHEELWAFGTEKTQVFDDTGNADTPFQPIKSAFVRHGCVASFTAVSIREGVAWISADETGGPVAYFAQGFAPQRISTHAIEAAWGEYSIVWDATAFVYVQDGHHFWVISFPTANATWVWDATAGKWHERGSLYTGVLGRQFAATHGFAFGQHIVGDWRVGNGNIYVQSPDVFTEAGTAIVRLRTAPHLSKEELWTFYSRFRLAMAGGPNPTLAWSDDLGKTFNLARAGSSRRISSTSDSANQVSEWRRLGRGRDRVFSVQMTDALQISLTGAYIDVEAGDG